MILSDLILSRRFRAKPFGIRYHPEIVLDVVYRGKLSTSPVIKKSRTSGGQIANAKLSAAVCHAPVAAKDAPNQDADAAIAVG